MGARSGGCLIFGLRFRDQLPGAIYDELEQLVAGLRGFLLIAHNEDGTLIAAPPVTNFVPTGAMMDWSVATAPTGWVICDGRQLNRVDYKPLFDVIGVTYGVGDGTTTFNIPDIRGKFKLGQAAAGTGSVLGATGGALDHTHSLAGLSIPSLSVSLTTSTDGAHTHSVAGNTGTEDVSSPEVDNHLDGSTVNVAGKLHLHAFSVTSGSSGSHSHTASGSTGTGTSGAGSSGANNPPYIALPVIIKT